MVLDWFPRGRWPSPCAGCGKKIPPSSRRAHDPATNQFYHPACAPEPDPEKGRAKPPGRDHGQWKSKVRPGISRAGGAQEPTRATRRTPDAHLGKVNPPGEAWKESVENPSLLTPKNPEEPSMIEGHYGLLTWSATRIDRTVFTAEVISSANSSALYRIDERVEGPVRS